MTQNYNTSSSLRRFRYGSRNLFLTRPLGSRPVTISGMDGRALGRQRHIPPCQERPYRLQSPIMATKSDFPPVLSYMFGRPKSPESRRTQITPNKREQKKIKINKTTKKNAIRRNVTERTSAAYTWEIDSRAFVSR